MKKFLAIVLVMTSVVAMFVLPTSAALPQEPSIQPMWENIRTVYSNMSFDGTEGCAYGYAVRKTDTDSIEGIMTVYKIVDGRWIYVASEAKDTSENYGVAFEFYFTGEVGYEYVLVFEVYAYSPAGGEDHTKYCYETCTGE